MPFNSLTYFIFLFIVVVIYWLLPHRRQNTWLLIASYIFYSWWDIRFLSLLIISTTINYYSAIMIEDGQISAKARMVSTTFIILICLFLINNLAIIQNSYSATLDWSEFISSKDSWFIIIAICIFLLLFNIYYLVAVTLDENKRKLFSVAFGVTTNLCILGFFKYYNFFIENIELFLKNLGFGSSNLYLSIILPVGISFYIFKGISYVIDVYRGTVPSEKSFINLALFISFFPALLAGPLDRAKDLIPQFVKKHNLNAEEIKTGLYLFLYGLFKKVVIADGVARTVNSVFGSSGQVSWIDVVIATVLFTIQIYCDFSGYTDMARGSAKFFGINLALNFNLPYFSKNPQEYWKRWHISLSNWLRDYLYIPLGGNREGNIKIYRNLLITMALGGLWHGAAWSYILWGLYHGFLLCIHRAIVNVKSTLFKRALFFRNAAKIALCFLAICYGFLLFRAGSLDAIVRLTKILIYDFGNMTIGALRPRAPVVLGLPFFILIEFIEYGLKGKKIYEYLPIPAWTAICALMIFSLFLGMSNETSQFIYFKF